jgi:ATP-dependent helicase HrpA
MKTRELNHQLRSLETMLPHAMQDTRQSVKREIRRIRQRKGAAGDNNDNNQKIQNRINTLEKKLHHSAAQKTWRKNHRPALSYDDNLPIVARRDDIISAIKKHQVVIISGETGSGKTTQLPKFCIDAGRGIDGLIGCTQPRRIAAMTVAQRIATEMNEPLGRSVGYKIRFADRMDQKTAFVKMMTDGILLAEAQSDRFLNRYDTLIIDEAHERSLNIDFILGILRNLLPTRKDLKLIITSATIDTEKFSKAFENAPVIEVSGRMYPVEVRYWRAAVKEDAKEETDGQSIVDLAADAVDSIADHQHHGDILVFMPTEHDIRETCEILEGRKYRHTTVLPLYGRLSAADQMKVFAPHPGRKIVVATNVAETSVTVPGIRYVVDTGTARISSYDPRTRTMSLPVMPVSRSSADQRKGRCGRVANGICIRLYSEEDYNNRELFTPPEILRANLAEVILRMISLKLGDISAFPFVDPPPTRQVKDGFDLLTELGAIVPNANRKKDHARFRLTPQGRLMARIPLGPRLSRMLIEAWDNGCIREVAVIVSALTIPDPREKPREAFTKAEAAHARFADPASDFITLYNIWTACFGHSTETKPFIRARDLKKFCTTHYMSFKRMREWQDVHEQITDILEESGFEFDTAPDIHRTQKENAAFSDHYTAIHKSILSGFLSNIAVKKEKNMYQAAKDRQVMIFPGSGLFNKAGQWIVAAEMVETSRLFARRVAVISSEWLEAIGAGLCKYSYSNPRWQKNREAVVADEQVSLYGLTLVSGRPVQFGPKDPETALDIFIESALVGMDVKTVLPFMRHNQALIEKFRDIENRVRRRDLVVTESDLSAFYRSRLSGHPFVFDIPTLKKRIRENRSDDFLKMTESDVVALLPDNEQLSLFPDAVPMGADTYACDYRFAPGETDDGVTLRMPVSVASALPMESTDWIVPGLLEEKIAGLIRALPKSYRKQLVPVGTTVKTIMDEMPKFEGSLVNSLSRFLFDRFHVDIPASCWNEKDLPDHLKMRIALTDDRGREIFSTREKAPLIQALSRSSDRSSQTDGFAAARRKWEKTGLTAWDFGDLPEVIHLSSETGARFPLYPALAKEGDKETDPVSLRLFKNQAAATAAHTEGVGQLFCLYFAKDIKFLKKQLKLPAASEKSAGYFGGKAKMEKEMASRVIRDLFCKNIRTQAEFYDYAQTAMNQLIPAGQALMKAVLPVVSVYAEARALFYAMETSGSNNPVMAAFIDALRTSLTALVPENFIPLYSADRMPDLVRYVRTLIVRAERGRTDMEKDRKKAARLQPFTDQLSHMIAGLEPDTSAEKRAAVEEFYWMIEEFKVSLFAQEIKTAFPVSEKKLNQEAGRISRMV